MLFLKVELNRTWQKTKDYFSTYPKPPAWKPMIKNRPLACIVSLDKKFGENLYSFVKNTNLKNLDYRPSKENGFQIYGMVFPRELN